LPYVTLRFREIKMSRTMKDWRYFALELCPKLWP